MMNIKNWMSSMTNGTMKEKFNGSWQGTCMKIAASKPEILLVIGGGMMLFGTIYACLQTDKAKEAVKKMEEDIKNVEKSVVIEENEQIKLLPETKKQLKMERGKQFTQIYAHFAYEMMKIYGVAALFWFGGLGMIGKSHFELRSLSRGLAADLVASNNFIAKYRERVAKAVGEETEKKIYLGTQEGMVPVIEKDPETGEEKVVEKKVDVFMAQPGSIFALNYTPTTSDAFDIRSFADHYLQARVDKINADLEIGLKRAYSALDILRMLSFNENAWGNNDEMIKKLLNYGISGNARKVPDPEMRKLKVTKLEGYEEVFDVERNMKVYRPCLRLDFNFYPLEGKI